MAPGEATAPWKNPPREAARILQWGIPCEYFSTHNGKFSNRHKVRWRVFKVRSCLRRKNEEAAGKYEEAAAPWLGSFESSHVLAAKNLAPNEEAAGKYDMPAITLVKILPERTAPVALAPYLCRTRSKEVSRPLDALAALSDRCVQCILETSRNLLAA